MGFTHGMFRMWRESDGTARATFNGAPLDPRLDLWNHSPTGIEWGYGGSGPAQLALAMLAAVLGDDARAVSVHQRFKWALVARADRGAAWELGSDQLIEIVEEIERRAAPLV